MWTKKSKKWVQLEFIDNVPSYECLRFLAQVHYELRKKSYLQELLMIFYSFVFLQMYLLITVVGV